jgi:tetratricopeptide (TPR) repeat protein
MTFSSMSKLAESADAFFSATMPSSTQYESLSSGALVRGIDAYTAEDYSTAIREFRRTIALFPNSDNALKAFEYLATAQVKNGQTAEAENTYKQAIKAFQTDDSLNLHLGNIYFSEGRYSEALEQYSTAVKKNPAESQNFYSLGQGYLALGRYSEAEEQFKKVIQLSPQDSGGYYALGQTYRMAGNYDEAQNQLDKALTIKKDFAEIHFELGMVFAEQQEIDKANDELDVLEEDAPELVSELQTKILQKTLPQFLSAYTANINLASKPGRLVSSLDASLATPLTTKTFTVDFVFDKEMDAASVQNTANWSISRSNSMNTGGPYNWGIETTTDVSIAPLPLRVTYRQDLATATVTFAITQNSTGDGTIDLSHILFKFKGVDVDGNSMGTSRDEYSGFSKIV